MSHSLLAGAVLLALLSFHSVSAQCPPEFTIAHNNHTQLVVSAAGDVMVTGAVVAAASLQGAKLQLTTSDLASAPACTAATLGSAAVIANRTSVCQLTDGTFGFSAVVTDASEWTTIALGSGVTNCSLQNGISAAVFAEPAYQIISNRVFFRGCFQVSRAMLTAGVQLTATTGALPPAPPFSWREKVLSEGLTALLDAVSGISYVAMNPDSGLMTATSTTNLASIPALTTVSTFLDGITYAL